MDLKDFSIQSLTNCYMVWDKTTGKGTEVNVKDLYIITLLEKIASNSCKETFREDIA